MTRRYQVYGGAAESSAGQLGADTAGQLSRRPYEKIELRRRVPEQIARKDSGHLHEPLTLLAYLAGLTSKIELVPSVLVLPARQTVLVAKQAAEVDRLSGGRLRLGIGVGSSRREFQALGQDFASRGRRCSEQMGLLKRLWTEEDVVFEGEFDHVNHVGINPLPIQRPIPMWIGGASVPSEPVLRRIGEHADGWFALCSPDEYPDLRARIDAHARAVEREYEGEMTSGQAMKMLFRDLAVYKRPEDTRLLIEGYRKAGLPA